MAGVRVNINSGEFALVASTPKTGLQVKAATNQRNIIRALRIMGKMPAGGTDPVVKIRMTRSTANFGTGSAATVAKGVPTDTETIQTTAFANFTVEPTTPTDGALQWEVQPQNGVIEYLPLDRPIVVPGGQSVNFECTSTGTPTLNIQADSDE